LNETFDLIFIDAAKDAYPEYYDLVIDKLRTGGILLADNVLWSGKVLNKNANDSETRAIRLFNKMVAADNRVEQVLLPLRDGLMVVRKI
ncbi:MAG: O-methyltransferase, partial [Bacteroidales bacterium]